MNHRAVVEHWSAQQYRNRDYQWGEMDDATFDALNGGDNPAFMLFATGCLDALEVLPAGSMVPVPTRRTGMPETFTRGVEDAAALRDEIDQILVE